MLKKYAYLLMMAIFASVLFTACDDEDNPLVDGDEIDITAITIGDNSSIYAEAGSTIRLDGSYFGLTPGSISLSGPGISGSTSLTATQWQDVRIEFTLPDDLQDGIYEVEIDRNDGEDDETIQLYVSNGGEPVLSSLTTLSAAADAVLVGFAPLGIEDWNQFDKYTVKYVATGSTDTMSVDIPDGTTQVIIDELTEGMVYNFMVQGSFINGTSMTNMVSKMWAPAARLTANGVPALLFTSDNQNFGSGLAIYDETLASHKVVTVSEGASWNFGIDTKTTGKVYFGSSNFLDYSIIPSAPGQLRATATNGVVIRIADSLDDLTSTPQNALDTYEYIEDAIDLNDLGLNTNDTGIVLMARVPNGNSYNYARIFIERDMEDGDFLHVDNNDEHVRVYISYQKTAGVPYAGI